MSKNPYGQEVEKFLKELMPDIKKAEVSDAKRNMLYEYAHNLPKKKRKFAYGALWAMRMYGKKSHKHPFTDHAFVRGLERIYNVNIDEVKNRMMRTAELMGYRLVKHGDAIVTVLRPRNDIPMDTKGKP